MPSRIGEMFNAGVQIDNRLVLSGYKHMAERKNGLC